MGKHANAQRYYNSKWEQDTIFKGKKVMILQEACYKKQIRIMPCFFKGCLTSDPGNKEGAYCKICRTSLRPHKSDLVKHQSSKKHLDRVK